MTLNYVIWPLFAFSTSESYSLVPKMVRNMCHTHIQGLFFIDTKVEWSYGRTVHFIDMRSFANCSYWKRILFDIWYMVLYFIRKVRKEKIWKHAILGKAISVRGNAKNGNVCSETASDSHCKIGHKTRTNDRILMK